MRGRVASLSHRSPWRPMLRVVALGAAAPTPGLQCCSWASDPGRHGELALWVRLGVGVAFAGQSPDGVTLVVCRIVAAGCGAAAHCMGGFSRGGSLDGRSADLCRTLLRSR